MSFPLTGNEKIRLTLENALKNKRIPHALLIDGDPGTGRHTLATFLAGAAVCSGEEIPCGSCRNCKLAESGNHPDITLIAPEEKKKSVSVDSIRQLKADAFIKPHEAQARVFIIDFADTMNASAQNALLKILEEPPGNTVFILIAENKSALLETVLSRCVNLHLNAPSQENAAQYLLSCTKFPADEIDNALFQTQNNIGRALAFLKGKADSHTALAAKQFIDCLLRGNEWGMLEVLAPFEKDRVQTDRLLRDMKYESVQRIKAAPGSLTAVNLTRFYTKLQEFEELLITNISLSLLFALMAAEAKKAIQ